jgi:hypothetical protein
LWTASEKAELAKVLTVICNGQKAYGKEVILADVYAYFEMKLQGRHSVSQVIYAIGKYTDSKNDIPAPSDVLNILNPKPPEITQTEYLSAKKWQEQNGYPLFSDALDTIEAFEKQERLKRESYQTEVKTIAQLAAPGQQRRIGHG